MNKQAKIRALEARISALQLKVAARRGIKDKTLHAPVIKMIEGGKFLKGLNDTELWSRGDGYHDNRRPGRGGDLSFTLGPDGPSVDDIGLEFQDALKGTVDWDPALGGKVDLGYSSDWKGNDNHQFKLTDIRGMERWIRSRIEKDFDSYQDAYDKALKKFDDAAAQAEAEEDFERSHRWAQGGLEMDKQAHTAKIAALEARISALQSKIGRGSKGIKVDPKGKFSMRDIPQDPYGQVYDAAILVDKRRTVQKAMFDIWRKHGPQIARMKNIWDATEFINDKITEMTGKYPDWHHYSMPD